MAKKLQVLANLKGKSAYDYAVESGYEGTEEEFAEKLAFEPFSEGAGTLAFSYTATFATDAATTNGVLVEGASATAILDTVYWLEVNGELKKCHWVRNFVNSDLYDEDGNRWVTKTLAGIYVSAPAAGTYSYKLYEPSENLALEPQYIPVNVAKKSDIPDAVVNPATAAVGQTIIVKEVDENGKPTAWEAVEYQPRTHWQGEKVMWAEETFEAGVAGVNMSIHCAPLMGLTAGKTYIVVFDGVTYTCVAQEGAASLDGVTTYDVISIGNPAMAGGEDNGLPFALCDVPAYETHTAACIPFVYGTHTLSVTGVDETYTIPVKYLSEGFPYILEVRYESAGTVDVFSCTETVDELMAILNSGREVKAKVQVLPDNLVYIYANLYTVYLKDGVYVVGFTVSNMYGTKSIFITLTSQDDGTWMVTNNTPFGDD